MVLSGLGVLLSSLKLLLRFLASCFDRGSLTSLGSLGSLTSLEFLASFASLLSSLLLPLIFFCKSILYWAAALKLFQFHISNWDISPSSTALPASRIMAGERQRLAIPVVHSHNLNLSNYHQEDGDEEMEEEDVKDGDDEVEDEDHDHQNVKFSLPQRQPWGKGGRGDWLKRWQ